MTKKDKPRILVLTGGLMSAAPDLTSLDGLAELLTITSSDDLEAAVPDSDAIFIWDSPTWAGCCPPRRSCGGSTSRASASIRCCRPNCGRAMSSSRTPEAYSTSPSPNT